MKFFIVSKKIDEYEIDEQEVRNLAIKICNFNGEELINWAKTASIKEIVENIPLNSDNYNYLLQSADSVETVSLEREILRDFNDAFLFCEEGLTSPIKFIKKKENN